MREKCRLCLGRIGYRKDSSIVDEAFSPMLSIVFSFPLPPTEPNLPTTVCARCVMMVRDFHNYSTLVQKNQDILRREYVNLVKPDLEDMKYRTKIPSQTESIEYGEKNEDEKGHATDSISEEEHLIADVGVMSDDKNDSLSDDDLGSASLNVVLQDNHDRNDPTKCVNTELPFKSHLHENDRIIQEFITMRCELCPARTEQHFDRFNALQMHYRKHHQCRGYLRCCGKQFYRRFRVMEHIASHRGMIHCELCSKTFTSKSYLIRHTAEQHLAAQKSKSYACEHCDRTFHTKKRRDVHRTVHDRTMCQICDKSVRIRYLKQHIAQIHDTPRKCYMCDLCGKNFTSSLSLDRHIKQHQGIQTIETLQCKHCDKQLRGKYNMLKHIQRMHQEVGNVYTCDECAHESPNSFALKEHKKRVHSGEQFECEQCGKRFKRKVYLTEHIAALHTRIPLYMCEFCEATFNSKANYYSHRKIRHAEEWDCLQEEKNAQELKG
ncbi:zinc finger protein 845-like [Anopheles moucheti]|uniref:zinc finger protein 845-like n=1 Tax=Anopheles moucheti TaxID=186751 RepID=UPI0022F01D9F|nr:zinc finger protein 845-like [Anopheles moucheti]